MVYSPYSFPLCVPLPLTVFLLHISKEAMTDLFGKHAAHYRMRTTDIWGGPDKLFDDEELTLEQAKVLPDDLLWLEEGKVQIMAHCNELSLNRSHESQLTNIS